MSDYQRHTKKPDNRHVCVSMRNKSPDSLLHALIYITLIQTDIPAMCGIFRVLARYCSCVLCFVDKQLNVSCNQPEGDVMGSDTPWKHLPLILLCVGSLQSQKRIETEINQNKVYNDVSEWEKNPSNISLYCK